MNRCLNNFFAYCNGTPDIITHSQTNKYIDYAGKEQVKVHFWGQCHLNPKTCGNLAIQSQLPLQSCPLGREAGKY